MGTIRATIDTKTLRGAVERSIVVTTNDPDPSRAQFNLLVRADVLVSVVILPSETVVLGTNETQRTARRVIRKDPSETGELKISGLVASAEWLDVSLKPADPAAPPRRDGVPRLLPGDQVLEISLKGRPPEGRHQESVEFQTGLTRQSLARLDVQVYSQPAVSFSRETLLFRQPVQDQTTLTESVLVSLRGDLDPAQLRIAVEPPQYTLKREPEGDGQFRLEVTWSAGAQTDGAVWFKIGEESASIPLRWERSQGSR